MSAEFNQNSVIRFTNRVENYIKYRPHYPFEIIKFLNDECGFSRSKIVADIGSGPGISSENFISNGNTLYAVEPNDDMRRAAEKIFSDKKNFISIKGTAEDTTLEGNSIDLIIAGQAFHWFDKEKCKTEFKRILKKDGYVVLMWNEKVSSNELMESYFSLLDKYGTDYGSVKHENVDDILIGKFFTHGSFKKKIFVHEHLLDYEGFEGRLLSSSYIPLEGEKFGEMINELKNIFNKNNMDGKVAMEYETIFYYGMLN